VLIELARVEEPAERERLLALARAGALTVRALRDVTLRKGGEGNGQPATAVPAQPCSGRSGFASKLERITARLRAARLAGRTLDEDERQGLLALKDEIERRLVDATPDVDDRRGSS